MKYWYYHDEDPYASVRQSSASDENLFTYVRADFYANDAEKSRVERMLKAYKCDRKCDSYRALTSFFGGHTRSQKFMAVDKLNQLLQGGLCRLTQTDVDCLKQGRLFRNIRGFPQLAGKVKGLKPGWYCISRKEPNQSIARGLGG